MSAAAQLSERTTVPIGWVTAALAATLAVAGALLSAGLAAEHRLARIEARLEASDAVLSRLERRLETLPPGCRLP